MIDAENLLRWMLSMMVYHERLRLEAFLGNRKADELDTKAWHI